MSTYSSFYINGQWVQPSTTDSLSVYDSVTEQVMATIPAGGAADVDAARAAFDSWSGLPREERAKFMSRIGDALAGRMDEIATVIPGNRHDQDAQSARPGWAADQLLQAGRLGR